MRKKGELLQFKDGWDLAESYPEGLRQRLNESKDPPKRRNKKKTAAKKKAEAKKADDPKKTAKPEAKKKSVAAEKGHLVEIADAVAKRA